MVGFITFMIIIFGEITPKSNAIMNSKVVAQKKAKALYYLRQILNPLISGFIAISQKLIIMSGGSIKKDRMLVSDESIKSLATLGEEEGVIKSIEREIIHKVFLFGDKRIEDIMVPMKNVFCLEKRYSISEAKKIIRERGFTRVPLMGEDNKIKGLVYSKDLLGRKDGELESFLRSPYIISPKEDITDIFKEMKKKRIHMAIVKNDSDEHIGIVTLEDIIEELVGEIRDEYFDLKFKNNSEPNSNAKKSTVPN
jgi:CBS domain containing-hemolysin-like protein